MHTLVFFIHHQSFMHTLVSMCVKSLHACSIKFILSCTIANWFHLKSLIISHEQHCLSKPSDLYTAMTIYRYYCTHVATVWLYSVFVQGIIKPLTWLAGCVYCTPQLTGCVYCTPQLTGCVYCTPLAG